MMRCPPLLWPPLLLTLARWPGLPLAVAASAMPRPTCFPSRSRSWGCRSARRHLQTSCASHRETSCPGRSSLLSPWPPLGWPSFPLRPDCHLFLLRMVRAITAFSRVVSSVGAVAYSAGAVLTTATTTFLEFLASQMMSVNLASFMASSCWN